MDACFYWKNNFLKIIDFHHDKDAFAQKNPYNCSFALAIRSGVFHGTAQCEYDRKAFADFIRDLNKLYNFTLSTAVLQDICYGSRVEFTMEKTGHLSISGKIYGDAMEHSLEFTFQADQTSLKQFLEELDALLRETE